VGEPLVRLGCAGEAVVDQPFGERLLIVSREDESSEAADLHRLQHADRAGTTAEPLPGAATGAVSDHGTRRSEWKRRAQLLKRSVIDLRDLGP